MENFLFIAIGRHRFSLRAKLFLVSPGFEFFRSLLERAISLGVSSLPAVIAFHVVSRALSPTVLLGVLLAVLELTGILLGILFLSTVVDVVSLLLAILTKWSLTTIGLE